MEEFKDVFISYKAEEFDDANWVKSVLEKNGVSCWMAPMCIKGGLSYATEIPRAIRNCKVFVLILSEKAQLSKWVPRELDQAINENKIIMPFMLENCSLKDDFNFYLDLNLKVDKNIEGYENFKMKDVIIYDDENNIYYADNSNLIEKYFSEKNIPLIKLMKLENMM